MVSQRLDPHARLHLRTFARQVGLLVLCCLPTLLIDNHAPILFFSLLKILFGFTALFLLITSFFFKHRTSEVGFRPSDHCLAFVLLQLGCSIVLRLIE